MNWSELDHLITPEKAGLFSRLHEWMYAESLRLNRTPIPPELHDPEEWRLFCHWKHLNWVRASAQTAASYISRLEREGKVPAANTALALAETPPPYRSKS